MAENEKKLADAMRYPIMRYPIARINAQPRQGAIRMQIV